MLGSKRAPQNTRATSVKMDVLKRRWYWLIRTKHVMAICVPCAVCPISPRVFSVVPPRYTTWSVINKEHLAWEWGAYELLRQHQEGEASSLGTAGTGGQVESYDAYNTWEIALIHLLIQALSILILASHFTYIHWHFTLCKGTVL